MHPSVVPDCVGQACHLLEVLSDVLLVLISLLLPQLADVVLQLHDGSLDLVVLTHEGHPAVKFNKTHTVSLQSKWSLNTMNIRKLLYSKHRLGLQFSQFGPSSELIVLPLPV